MNKDIILNIAKCLIIQDTTNFMCINKYTYDSLNINILWQFYFDKLNKKYDQLLLNEFNVNYKDLCKKIILIEKFINWKYIKNRYNFNQLINLQQLYLFNNHIIHIPIEIGQL